MVARRAWAGVPGVGPLRLSEFEYRSRLLEGGREVDRWTPSAVRGSWSPVSATQPPTSPLTFLPPLIDRGRETSLTRLVTAQYN